MLLPVCLLAFAPVQSTWYVDAHNPGPGTGVSDDPFLTVQEAVDAPTTLSGDSIRVRDGVYREAIVIDGKELRVIAGHGMENVVFQRVDADGVPCVAVRNVASPGVLIAGVRFEDASIVGNSGRGIELESGELEVSRCDFSSLRLIGSSTQGGAVQAGVGSSLELLGCSFVDCGRNSVTRGGAVAFEGDVLSIEGCSFLNNVSRSFGGGVWFNGSGSMTIRNSVFRDNQASNGGAVWMETAAGDATIRGTDFVLNGHPGTLLSGGVRGQGVIENCLFRRNLGQENGAVAGSWEIRGTEFDRNGGSDSGNWASAVHGQPHSTLTNCFVHDHIGASSYLPPSAVINADVVNCVFENNLSVVDNFNYFINGGGAITDCVAVDSVFRGNSTSFNGSSNPNPDETGRGGAAYRSVLTRCVFTGNSAVFGGVAAESELHNCTLFGNSAAGEAGALWGGTMANTIAFDNGVAPLGNGAAATWSCVEFGAPGAGNIAMDPSFLLPGSGDLRLRGTSPCIDAGDPNLTDPGGSRRDMGAFPFEVGSSQSYCAPGPDSVGCTPALRSLQNPTASRSFRFEATGVLATTLTLCFVSTRTAELPYLNGQLCIGAPLSRGPVGVVTTGSSGPCDTAAEFTLTPAELVAMGFAPGDVLYTQAIYRDPGGSLGVAITGALSVVFQP